MILSFVLFFLGLIILLKGAGILVDGASGIARRVKVAGWIIGLTVVGIGTSIPELSITLFSFARGEIDIGLGTIFGSNTFNILLILGISAIVTPLVMERDWVVKDLPQNFLAVLAAIFILNFPVLGNSSFFGITQPEGILLLLLFFIWLAYEIFRKRPNARDEEGKALSSLKSVLMIGGGLVGVILGGEMVVGSASSIASIFGVSQALIGLTIVGLGSSLPELVISVIAAYKKRFGIAVGNIIGSNVFDFLGILGIAALFKPVPFSKELTPDVIITFGSSFLLFILMFVGRKKVLERWEGALFVTLYLAYLIFILQRG